MKKHFNLFVIIYLCLITYSYSSVDVRRNFRYTTPQAYIQSFTSPIEVKNVFHIEFSMNENIRKPKILVIGGGLVFDVNVRGQVEYFFDVLYRDRQKNRLRVYPYNAYLVNMREDTIPDLVANITENMGVRGGLPVGFSNTFDVVVCEYLPTDAALTIKAIENINQVLKPGGIVVMNNPLVFSRIEAEIAEDYEWIDVAITKGETTALETIRIFYINNDRLLPTLSRFHFYCLNEDDAIKLYAKADEVFIAVYDIISSWFITKGFRRTEDLNTTTEYWFSSDCDTGYLIAHK